jgi:hypothetical protein
LHWNIQIHKMIIKLYMHTVFVNHTYITSTISVVNVVTKVRRSGVLSLYIRHHLLMCLWLQNDQIGSDGQLCVQWEREPPLGVQGPQAISHMHLR